MKFLQSITHKTRRFLTLDGLADSEEDLEELKGLTKRQRLALYNYLTARAYRLNKDTLRDSALWTRNCLIDVTRAESNIIPYDRVPKKPKHSDNLPQVFDDSVSQ